RLRPAPGDRLGDRPDPGVRGQRVHPRQRQAGARERGARHPEVEDLRGWGLALALVGLALALPAEAEELRGRVQLVAKGGKASGSDVRQAVVYYEPASGSSPRSSDS